MSTKTFLQRDKFPQCCGATILSGFGHSYHLTEKQAKEEGWPTKKEIKAFLMEIVDLGTHKFGPYWHEMQHNAFHMAILSNNQKANLHDTFIAAGFEVVSSNLNTHSNRDNHLYVRKVAH